MENSYEDFRTYGKQMVDYICDYVQTMDERPVAPTAIEPGFLSKELDTEAPQEPESFNKTMDDFEKKIMKGIVHWNHSNFYAYFGSGNGYPSILGDMLSSAIAAIGFSWASCPSLTELEQVMLDWYAKALDLPPFFLSKKSNPESDGGGALQGSASDAIFAAMCAARARAIKHLKGNNHEIHDSVYLPKLVCYASSEAHSCVEKAAKMNLVELTTVDPDSHDSMRGDALERAIEKDIARGLTPFFVVGTVGTTSQVAFDNLAEIGQVCQKHPTMWFHVDGAYGGNSFLIPEMRHFKEGMEYVDSFETNPNKMMLTSFDCTCLWVKNVITFTSAFAVDPIYLQHQHENAVVDLRHFGTPLSRRFRALKLYFTFRLYGIKRLQEYIRRVIEMGKFFEKLVKEDDRFEIRNDVHLGLACFRLLQPDSVNQEFLARMNASGKIHLTPAKVKGKYIIRFVANQETCNEAQIEGAWEIIKNFATETIKDVGYRKKPRPEIKKFDLKRAQRFSFTRNVSQEIYERQSSIQKLMDGATPIVVFETDDILQSLQRATMAERETENRVIPESNGTCTK